MKKFVSSLLVFTLMLVFSTGAFAAKGIGDTKENAISLIPGNSMSLYIEDRTDKDWYKWTNNTGVMKDFTASVRPIDTSEWRNFRLAFKIDYNNGTSTGLVYADYNSGPTQYFTGVYIPNGASLYLIVEKVNDVMSQYQINLNVGDI
jgi:hypothetical protein